MRAADGITEFSVRKVDGTCSAEQHDALAIEEPLEIRLGYDADRGRTHKSISITMRTPTGFREDHELAAGFLFTEGIITRANQISSIKHCGSLVGKRLIRNVVRVELAAGATIDLKRLERHFYTTSSCGVCGKTSLEALQTIACPLDADGDFVIGAEVVHRLPESLRDAQSVFDRTGGLHAAALFDARGNLEAMREDVGRHNAVDKLIGAQVLADKTPLHERLVFVSGRASFELVQKTLMAGIPVLAAVGAPSSLAVELAERFNMTLLGFVRQNRFNIYAGAQRILTRERAKR